MLTRFSTPLKKARAHHEFNIVKCVYIFGHATVAEMRELLSGTDLNKEKVKKACEAV